MRKVLISLFLSTCLSVTVNAQEAAPPCTVKFEVNAGPDIDVCESGTVGLSGILGGEATRGVWRGGKGLFEPNRSAAQVDYTPDTSEYGTTIVLTFVGDNPNFPDCPKGRDDVQIRVNRQPKVSAGENVKVCQSQAVPLKGKLISGKAQRFQWTSNGSGTFSDAMNPETVYTPSAKDAQRGAVTLTFKAYAFGVCMNDSDMIAVTVKPMPEITLPAALTGEGLKPVPIAAKVEGSTKLKWSSSGSGKFESTTKATTGYTPSEEDLAKGTVTLTLKARGEQNCDVEKSLELKLSAASKQD